MHEFVFNNIMVDVYANEYCPISRKYNVNKILYFHFFIVNTV